MAPHIQKDGTVCFHMRFGPLVDTVQISVNKDAACRQRLRLRDFQDPNNPYQLFFEEITEQKDIFVYLRDAQRGLDVEVCVEWAHPGTDHWYPGDYHIFNDGSNTNAYDIGWDDLTNGQGGNPDGDFNDIRLTTVAISKRVSTKHLEVFY